MSDPVPIEPERYELSEPARYTFEPGEIDRREFLRLFSVMGGGLLVVAVRPSAALAQQGESGRGGGQGRGAQTGDLASWLHIDERGHVTVYTGKVEIGQNARTSLAQTVGDELRVPLAAISLVMADTDLTPYDAGTFGSQTTPRMAPVLARAAATAREMLIDQAARTWQVDRSTLAAHEGAITGAGGRSASYGELTHGQTLMGAVAANALETPRDRWTLRGTPAHKVNGREIVTGRHAFTPDVTRPSMLMGRVIRPIAYGATPLAVDAAKAQAIAGVVVVRDGDFIGVVAPSERAVKRAAAAMAVQWKTQPGLPTSENVYDVLKKTAQAGRPAISGDVASAKAGAARTFEASYRIPYIAHVPLEPRAAVAEWAPDGKLTVWTGTQRPFGVRTEVAQAFHLSEERVRVIVPDMGSGYGGKHTGEQAIEAARLAKAAGKPVKLVYTRAEEFSWGYFRPAGVIDVSAAVDVNGRVIAWEFDNYNSGGAGIGTPYAIPNQRITFHSSESPLRQGSYRGLAATANHYVREMQMDLVARTLGVDAVQFRLQHIDDPRLRAVLTTAAEQCGWPRPSAPGRAVGIACGTEKGSYIATAAEVSIARAAGPASSATREAPTIVLHRLVVVFEAGAIVNPDGLKNQAEGAVIQGLGGALFESIRFADGKILNGTMEEYRVPRFRDVPPIEVVLLDRRDLPSAGAGETPIVCVAPAIGSAVRTFGKVADALPVTLVS